jgi:hypothetical protein
MALGYEGWAKLNVNGTETLLLCTGASVPNSRVRLESSSGYGGQIKTPTDEIGIGFPHTYDWTTSDGTMSFEVYEDLLTGQMVPWLFDRQKAATVTLQSRRNNQNIHTECFWNSIGLNTSSGAAVEGSIGFMAVDTGTYAMGGGYIENKQGSEFFCDPPVGLQMPEPLITNVMVPYWQSNVYIDGALVEFISWSLDYSQDIVKFFTCEHNANPIEPKFVAAGPMTVTFTGEYFFYSAAPSWSVPNYISTLDINIAGTTLKTKRGERNSSHDDVLTADTPVPINVEYSLYEITT